MWLEAKRVPYEVRKVNMICYGDKEAWYKELVPSGLLPAVALDGRVLTESDAILIALERTFGELGGRSIEAVEMLALRRLERALFSAWCQWLCYPADVHREELARRHFLAVLAQVDAAVVGPFMLGEQLSAADAVFAPFLDRMHASLLYYKGVDLRCERAAPAPRLRRWFDALGREDCYRGIRGDVHTHAHALPPQMGGCYSSGTPAAHELQRRVDLGLVDAALRPEPGAPAPREARFEAVRRVCGAKDGLLRVNPSGACVTDVALRAALSRLLDEDSEEQEELVVVGQSEAGHRAAPEQEPELCALLPQGTDAALRYVRDRISVPRDMSPWAAYLLRDALERTAATAGTTSGPPIPTRDRMDQSTVRFHGTLSWPRHLVRVLPQLPTGEPR
jgi:glutathione S-transferase